jgi:hypothetical protein
MGLENLPSLGNQLEKMTHLAHLKAPDLNHLATELHAQPVDLKARPIVIKQNLCCHCLPMPRRRCLTHEEYVGHRGLGKS